MRTAGSNRESTMAAISEAGIDLIFQYGFPSTTLRMVAKKVGMQAGSLYNYFEDKQSFLYQIMKRSRQDLLEELDRKLTGNSDPVRALKAFIEVHIEFYTERSKEMFIGRMELRGLTDEQFRDINALRDRYEWQFTSILENGRRTGDFIVDDIRLTTYAILAMLTDISTWYRPRGRMTKGQLIEYYTNLVFRILRCERPDATGGSDKPAD